MLSKDALKGVVKLVKSAYETSIENGEELVALQDLSKIFEEALEKPPVIECTCCGNGALNSGRVYDEKGFVVSSFEKMYLLTEEDVLNTAERYGVKLTGEQMDHVARYVDKGYDPIGNWEETIQMALEEEGFELNEEKCTEIGKLENGEPDPCIDCVMELCAECGQEHAYDKYQKRS
jgi:hypothetical protein